MYVRAMQTRLNFDVGLLLLILNYQTEHSKDTFRHVRYVACSQMMMTI